MEITYLICGDYMLSSLLEFFTKHIDKVACGYLLCNFAQWVHSSDADLDYPIHVIPLITHNNFDA